MALECAKCKKTFKALSWLKRHERRKTPCAPYVEPSADSKYLCKHCGRDYASQKNLHVHVSFHCKIAARQGPSATAEPTYVPAVIDEQALAVSGPSSISAPGPADINEMAEIKTQNARLMSMLEGMIHLMNATNSTAGGNPALGALAVNATMGSLVDANPSLGALTANATMRSHVAPNPVLGALAANTAGGAIGAITNTNTNTTQAAGEVGFIQCDYNNIATDKSITFNTFGNESLAHVTSARVRGILDDSMRETSSIQAAARMAVTKTAMLIFSDPDHPENLTCYLPNKKTNDVLVHTALGWEIYPIAVVINTIGQKTIDHLFAKQPFEDADLYTLIMKELQQNERAYISDAIVRPILVRNRSQLEQSAGSLPKSGTP